MHSQLRSARSYSAKNRDKEIDVIEFVCAPSLFIYIDVGWEMNWRFDKEGWKKERRKDASRKRHGGAGFD